MIRGKTTSLWKDRQRLVLAIFLASVALWAQIGFVAVAVDPASSAAGCQVAVAFASAFDQLATVALLQYFLLATAGAAPAAVRRLVPQGLLAARLVLGGVFVGMQRSPPSGAVCVPTTELLPVAIAVISADAVLFIICAVRLFARGGLRDAGEGTVDRQKATGVAFAMGSFVLWAGVSDPTHRCFFSYKRGLEWLIRYS
jgi:hypothetical protein